MMALTKRTPKLAGRCRSKSIHVDDGVGERLWGFLRQVVPDSASQVPMHILAGELRRIRSRARVRCAVRIPFERDGGHDDEWPCREPTLERVVGRLAFSLAEAPAIVVNDDAHVI